MDATLFLLFDNSTNIDLFEEDLTLLQDENFKVSLYGKYRKEASNSDFFLYYRYKNGVYIDIATESEKIYLDIGYFNYDFKCVSLETTTNHGYDLFRNNEDVILDKLKNLKECTGIGITTEDIPEGDWYEAFTKDPILRLLVSWRKKNGVWEMGSGARVEGGKIVFDD